MSRFPIGHLPSLVVGATLAVLTCAVSPASAATNVTTPVQVGQPPVFVTPPHIDQIGDDLGACRSQWGNGYRAELANCISSVLAGDIEITLRWSGMGCPQPCASSVSSFTLYRVPASLVVRTDIQIAPPATPQRAVAAPAGAQAPAPGSITHVAQMPPLLAMTDHVAVASGNEWVATWGFGSYAMALLANPKIGDCFVARVSTSDHAQSGDSNKVCIDGSVKFGTEVAQFKSTSGSGSFTIMNANNCYDSWTSYAHGSGVGSVGWQLYSTTAVNSVPPNGAPCTGIQVLQTSYGFQLGNIPLPIVKAELMSIGDASCVSEVDIGGSKFQVPQQPSLDQDVTSGVGATAVTATFIPHPRAGALPLANGCLSQLQGAVLKITRLK